MNRYTFVNGVFWTSAVCAVIAAFIFFWAPAPITIQWVLNAVCNYKEPNALQCTVSALATRLPILYVTLLLYWIVSGMWIAGIVALWTGCFAYEMYKYLHPKLRGKFIDDKYYFVNDEGHFLQQGSQRGELLFGNAADGLAVDEMSEAETVMKQLGFRM
jgi:hypothetical protein